MTSTSLKLQGNTATVWSLTILKNISSGLLEGSELVGASWSLSLLLEQNMALDLHPCMQYSSWRGRPGGWLFRNILSSRAAANVVLSIIQSNLNNLPIINSHLTLQLPSSAQAWLVTRLITMRSQPNCFEVVLFLVVVVVVVVVIVDVIFVVVIVLNVDVVV